MVFKQGDVLVDNKQDEQRKIMLISRSYDGGEIYSHLQQIIQLANDNSTDTVMFAGWAYDRKHPVPTHETMFNRGGTVNHILIEMADTINDSDMETLFFSRNEAGPRVINQRFGYSSDSGEKKEAFNNELQDRVIDDTACIVCGEISSLIYSRKQEMIIDDYEINDKLAEANVKVILNYWHSYGRRYEINKKRQHLSLNGRTLLSVWNLGCFDREAKLPWAVFTDGQNKTHEVQEVSTPFSDRPDIRIGIYQF